MLAERAHRRFPQRSSSHETRNCASKVSDFLKASPPAPRIESSRTDAEYKKLRWQVFAGVFIGYAAYYLIRKNFSLAIPYLIDEYGFTKADLGTVGVALSLAYGFSKFIMGNISDRSNPKYFITIGLLGSALVSLIFGLVPGVLSSIPVSYTHLTLPTICSV